MPITVCAKSSVATFGRRTTWGATQRQIFWRVLLPAAAPSIFAGMRIALPISLIVVIITEMIGESRGLGYYISYASASFEYATAFAGIAAVAIIGFTLDRLMVWLRNRVIFWERRRRFHRRGIGNGRTVMKRLGSVAAAALLASTICAMAQPVTIRLGHGPAAEEQLWLMKAKPDITPGQGKDYTLDFQLFRGTDQRFKAVEARQLDVFTGSASSAILAWSQGFDFKAVASVTRESNRGFVVQYMALAEFAGQLGCAISRGRRSATMPRAHRSRCGRAWRSPSTASIPIAT